MFAHPPILDLRPGTAYPLFYLCRWHNHFGLFSDYMNRFLFFYPLALCAIRV